MSEMKVTKEDIARVLTRASEIITRNPSDLAIEQNVRRTIIEPILRACGWDTDGLDEVKGEYSVGSGRVDYALFCKSEKSPLVYIEAKKLDGLNTSGEDQLFQYAYKYGVPLLLLTDGNIWDFYLSTADGPPTDRRFYRMKLTQEKNLDTYAEILNRSLTKEAVCNETFRQTADQLRNKRKAKQAIPGVWKKLLNNKNEALRDLIAGEVANETGQSPDIPDVEAFMQDFMQQQIASRPVTPSVKEHTRTQQYDNILPSSSPSSDKPARKHKIKIIGFEYNGKRLDTKNGRRTLQEVLKLFQTQDPTFIEQYYEATSKSDNTSTRLKKGPRQVVAKSLEALYRLSTPEAWDIKGKWSIQLHNGWLADGHLNTNQIVKHIRVACTVMDVRFGKDLKLIER